MNPVSSLRSAVVVVIDRWGAPWFGPYGNTWIPTPGCNRLAAEGETWEFAFASSTELADIYSAYWSGRSLNAVAPSPGQLAGGENAIDLFRLARNSGIRSCLITDDSSVAKHPLASGCDELVQIPLEFPDRPCDQPSQTQMVRLFSAAVNWLDRATDPYFLWIHSSGMAGPWDAPLDFRNRFADEEDPLPPETVVPPSKVLAVDFDPDERLGLVHAYAGQVLLGDMCLADLREVVVERSEPPLLIVTSPRGFPLGEHLAVGEKQLLPYSELAHVPRIIRQPGKETALRRRSELVSESDLFTACTSWLDPNSQIPPTSPAATAPVSTGLDTSTSEGGATERFVLTRSPGGWSLRTSDWTLIRPLSNDDATPADATPADAYDKLFARPDDRWEANNVADRCRPQAIELGDRLSGLLP